MPILLIIVGGFLQALALFMGWSIVAKIKENASRKWQMRRYDQFVWRAVILWFKRRRAWGNLPWHKQYRRQYKKDPDRKEYQENESFIDNIVRMLFAQFGAIAVCLFLIAGLSYSGISAKTPRSLFYGLMVEVGICGFLYLTLRKTDRDVDKRLLQDLASAGYGIHGTNNEDETVEVLITESGSASAFPEGGADYASLVQGEHVKEISADPRDKEEPTLGNNDPNLAKAWEFLKKLEVERESILSPEALARVDAMVTDKQAAIKFLQDGGFLDKNGKLAIKYRS